MGKLIKKNESPEMLLTKAGKGLDPPSAYPDDPCEDLLDGPLPAG
jgi:hypothetical protein